MLVVLIALCLPRSYGTHSKAQTDERGVCFRIECLIETGPSLTGPMMWTVTICLGSSDILTRAG